MVNRDSIRVVHFHHNDKNNLNIGDQAHVVAIQEALSRLSKYPIDFQEKSIQLLGRQVIPSKFYYPKSKYYPTIAHNVYRSLIGESIKKVLNQCNSADLVIIGGGGVYMAYLFPLNNQFIKKIKTPISIIGVGYNHNHGSPEFTKSQLKSVRVLSHQSSLQSVRDDRTVKFLEHQGIDAELMCDPAIFLSEQDTGLITNTKGVMNVGINIARHGWNNQNKLRPILVKRYADAIRHIQKNHKARIFYMMHQPNESYYVEALKSEGVHFDGIVKVADARELKAAYSHLDFTISMMLHSTILAFGAGVPSINVGYDDKNIAFMKMTGQAERYISVNDIASKRFEQIIDRTISKLRPATSDLAKYKKEFSYRFDDFIRRTLSLVNESPRS